MNLELAKREIDKLPVETGPKKHSFFTREIVLSNDDVREIKAFAAILSNRKEPSGVEE